MKYRNDGFALGPLVTNMNDYVYDDYVSGVWLQSIHK